MSLRALARAAALLLATSAGAREPAALTTLAGDAVSLARAPSERALVVHFWATWCDDCTEELPVVARAAEVCAARAVSVRIVATGESARDVRAFLREHGLAIESLLDPEGRAWRAAGGFGVPANWVRTPEGDRLLTGPRTSAQWRELLGDLGCDVAPTRPAAAGNAHAAG